MLLSKIDEMNKNYEISMSKLRDYYQKELKQLEIKLSIQEEKRNQQGEKIKRLEEENKEIEKKTRFQMLNGISFIEDQDLEFNLPLKKRNCLHVKNVQKAKDLGGITSLKDLERLIDGNDFQDIIEVENTLNCLESVFNEWKNGKLKLDGLENEMEVTQDSNEWKLKDHTDLTTFIFEHFDLDQFKNFEICKRINMEFFNMRHSMKGKIVDQVYKDIIEKIIEEWKTQNNFNEEMKEFISMIPIDSSIIVKNFKWKMLPKWNQRREKLRGILKIQSQ